jgi:hypothetical protein
MWALVPGAIHLVPHVSPQLALHRRGRSAEAAGN